MEKEELRERYEAFGDEQEFAEARRLYEAALAADPDNARLLTEYGYLLDCHGRYAMREAAECYGRAVSADPVWLKPQLQLLAVRAALGQIEDSIAWYERRHAEAPGDAATCRLLGMAYAFSHNYPEAERLATEGLAIAPDDPALIELRGDILADTGRPDEALATWRRAADLTTDDYGISMHYSAAFLLERMGRLAEAAQEWRFIIGWCEERGDAISADWPRRELTRLEDQPGQKAASGG